jgi:hypothetical protein
MSAMTFTPLRQRAGASTFLVDSPSENGFGYWLCSYVFGAFPRVFGSDTDSLEGPCNCFRRKSMWDG